MRWIEHMVASLDSGFDVDELILLEQIVHDLQSDGVDDEGVLLAVCDAAIGSLRAAKRLQAEMN